MNLTFGQIVLLMVIWNVLSFVCEMLYGMLQATIKRWANKIQEITGKVDMKGKTARRIIGFQSTTTIAEKEEL